MNLVDKKINDIYQSVLQIDTSSMKFDKEKNHKGDLLMSFFKEYKNDIYIGELIICLKAGFQEFSEDTIGTINMELKHKHNPNKRFQLIYSPSQKRLIVESGGSALYTTLYTRSENNDRKYPRARDSDSPLEQIKTHKIVSWGINALQKLLLTSQNNNVQNTQIDIIKHL